MKTLHHTIQKGLKGLFCGLAALSITLCLTGCDDGTDDYDPPAGYGALTVNNQTSTDIYVYVDGLEVGKVGDYSDKHYDLTPGVHRVVLDEHDGNRSWHKDVDILDDRLTILTVTFDSWDNHDYNVSVDFD